MISSEPGGTTPSPARRFRPLVALATGLLVGLIGLLGGLPGLVVALLVGGVAAVAHLRSGDIPAIAFLALGAGLAWASILGRVLLEAAADPAVSVEPLTVWSFAFAVVLTVLGGALVAVTRSTEGG